MKQLLEGYVGVKFLSERVPGPLPAALAALYPRFQRAGQRLDAHGMAPANGGNMSLRLGQGLVVTASGSNLGILEPDELAWVESADAERELVRHRGGALPSSEAIMHWLVLQARPQAQAVVHAHDPLATRQALLQERLPETLREEPYGTVALARLAIRAFGREQPIIVLREHGYVCAGPSLEAVIDIIVGTHLRLLAGSSALAAPVSGPEALD